MDKIKMLKEKKLESSLLEYEPWEAIGPIFSYFANVFQEAPNKKLNEFFEYFEGGVRDHIRHNRIIRIVPWLKDY